MCNMCLINMCTCNGLYISYVYHKSVIVLNTKEKIKYVPWNSTSETFEFLISTEYLENETVDCEVHVGCQENNGQPFRVKVIYGVPGLQSQKEELSGRKRANWSEIG